MKQRLYKFGALEIARDESDRYYLIENGQVTQQSQEWRMIVTSFFGLAEMRVLKIIAAYEEERKRMKSHEQDKL